ncbi:MAG TPA: trypsin-like peptidase domain-containing protein, partial [Trueperaceae bacterium]|nr:trypsin-like peptidase domain-containing protein [Trueperaceae bacterium]
MRRVLLATLVLAGAALAAAQGLPRDVRLNIVQAVVQVIPYDSEAGSTVNWSGSGTIISPSGHVLTNYHVVGDLGLRRHHEWHAILITSPQFTDQPPEFTFWARFVAGDPTHDLAVLKIEEWYDEEPVGSDVVFPHVLVGDSNQLIPGDSITIVGYP